MHSNFTVDEFKAEIVRRENEKLDLIAPTKALRMTNDGEHLEAKDYGQFVIQPNFHSQIATHHKITKPYYDAMAQIPGLRAYNVNAWLDHANEERMVRTLDGQARAYMSASYRPFDNGFALKAVAPVFSEFKDLEVKASSLSDIRMYLQVVFPKLEGEVRKGDTVQQGIIITNSEVGRGALNISSLIWRLVCLNGMIGESIISRRHVGSRIDFGSEEDVNIYGHDTIEAELESYRLRVRDVIRHALSEAEFHKRLEDLRVAAEDEIPRKKVKETIEKVVKKFQFTEQDMDDIFANITDGGDRSRYGLANAITALAHEDHNKSNPDKAYDFEVVGSKIITLSASEWKILAA